MQINCNMCMEPFDQFGTQKQPRVIPCGHSFCQDCLYNRLNHDSETFECPICLSRHQMISLNYAPVNRLYYTMMEQMVEYLKRRDWERQHSKQDNDSEGQERNYLDEEYKCLYPFCHRVRYEKDGVRQVFCSAKCFQLNEILEQQY